MKRSVYSELRVHESFIITDLLISLSGRRTDFIFQLLMVGGEVLILTPDCQNIYCCGRVGSEDESMRSAIYLRDASSSHNQNCSAGRQGFVISD